MQLTVTVRGELVRKGLQDLDAEIPKVGRQQIRTRMEAIKRKMQEYPPEPAGQSVASSHPVLGTIYRRAKGRYRRTGDLGRGWAITQVDNGYKLENTASHRGKQYGKYVVGNAYGQDQAWMHQGRWQLLRDVVEEEIDKLPQEIEEKIQLVARRAGL